MLENCKIYIKNINKTYVIYLNNIIVFLLLPKISKIIFIFKDKKNYWYTIKKIIWYIDYKKKNIWILKTYYLNILTMVII